MAKQTTTKNESTESRVLPDVSGDAALFKKFADLAKVDPNFAGGDVLAQMTQAMNDWEAKNAIDLEAEVMDFREAKIAEALKNANGKRTLAAKMVGYTPQQLAYWLRKAAERKEASETETEE